MHIHTGKRKISNLIHSGSSYNIRAAQQVVLWCLSLVLKCCDTEFHGKRKRGEKKRKNITQKILLSPRALHGCPLPSPLPKSKLAHLSVFAVFRPWADMFQKCYRRAEGIFEDKKKGGGRDREGERGRKKKEGLQEATPFTARQDKSLNSRRTKASWSQREGGQN